ncbi:hypothetical protein imdm_640 [gamma proteobacterium IMCC2047]|nr:hypothetical protein imdm_640 [gamma proteobacterium IMCC2047]
MATCAYSHALRIQLKQAMEKNAVNSLTAKTAMMVTSTGFSYGLFKGNPS